MVREAICDQVTAVRVTQSLALHRPYFLSLGTIEPRRNIDALLTAWQRLPNTVRREYELAVAGMPGWNSDPTMTRLKQAAADQQGVRCLGYVVESEEGFGIPVAQAMAAGCPIITSNVSIA